MQTTLKWSHQPSKKGFGLCGGGFKKRENLKHIYPFYTKSNNTNVKLLLTSNHKNNNVHINITPKTIIRRQKTHSLRIIDLFNYYI